MKTVSVMEGDTVTLQTNVTNIPKQNIRYIQWMFGPENTFIVIRFNRGAPDIDYFNAERFRDRLQMDSQTGSLTIRNIRTTDSGLYQLQMIKYIPIYFNITVYGGYFNLIYIFKKISDYSNNTLLIQFIPILIYY